MKHGEVYYVSQYQTLNAASRAMHSGRPAVILSSATVCARRNTVTVCFMTTQHTDEDRPFRVLTECTGKTSSIVCDQVCTVDFNSIGDFICELPSDTLQEVDNNVMQALALRREDSEDVPAETSNNRDYENLKLKYHMLQGELKAYKDMCVTMMQQGGYDYGDDENV